MRYSFVILLMGASFAQQEWYIPKRTEVLKKGTGELGFRLQTLSDGSGTAQSRVTELTPSFRYSPLTWLEFYIEVPEVYAEQEFVQGAIPVEKTETSIGDTFTQLSFDVFSGQDWRVLPSLDLIFPTGRDPYENLIGTGSGVYKTAIGVTGIKVVDPVALFAFLGYQHSVSETYEIGKVEPGDAYRYRVGTSISMNPQVRLAFHFSGDIVGSSKLGGELTPGSSQDVLRFGVRIDWSMSPSTRIAFDAIMGISSDSPDSVLSLGISWSFGN